MNKPIKQLVEITESKGNKSAAWAEAGKYRMGKTNVCDYTKYSLFRIVAVVCQGE